MTITQMKKEPEKMVERIHQATQAAMDSQESLNAVVTMIDPKDQIDQLAQKENGKLAGIPIALKDNVNTKGIKTTASSKILENYIPIYDATIVEKLRDAGAVFIAKASMDELAMGGTNLTAATGPVHNPYDLTRIAGGSSGGSAALVAAGVVPMAIGTDTGDSIRKPAAYCGIVGLKPSYGRISRYGIIPYSSSLDHVGLFTRSVEDAALCLEVLAGRDDRDMTSSFAPVENYLDHVNDDVSNRKVAVLKNVVDAIENPEVLQQFNSLLEKMREKGIEVKEVSLNEQLMKAILPTYYILANCEATANHSNLDGIRFGAQKKAPTSEEIMIKTRTEGFGPLIRKRFVMGSYGLFVENQEKLLRQAQRTRRLIVEDLNKVLCDVDCIIAPAASGIAPKIEGAASDQLSDQYLIAENHMVLGNFSGYPSITVPNGFVEGLPIGVNLTSKAFDETTLLNVAKAIEDITGLKDSKAGN